MNSWITRAGLYIILLIPLVFMACNNIVLIVDDLPENTPENSKLYITGNFNHWDPGDSRFQMEKRTDGSYVYRLSNGYGNVQLAITRGSIYSIEGDICGNEISPRQFRFGVTDTLRITPLAWVDLGPSACPIVTYVIDEYPVNTPPDDFIYVAGNFNSWDPGNSEFRFTRQEDFYYLTMENDPARELLEFKFTRGHWENVEVDDRGIETAARTAVFGYADTLEFKIADWADLASQTSSHVTIMVESIPTNTPPGSNIYLAGNFNNWNPRDKNFMLNKSNIGSKERYYVFLYGQDDDIEFKFTRGSWKTVEGDSVGRRISNRTAKYQNLDTLRVHIEGWEDITRGERPMNR